MRAKGKDKGRRRRTKRKGKGQMVQMGAAIEASLGNSV